MVDRPSRGAKLLRNSVLNVSAFGLSLLLAVLLLPFVIRRIGIADFGRAGLVIACFAPLQVVGTVLGQSVAREMASRHKLGSEASPKVLSAALCMCTAVVLLVFLILLVALLCIGPQVQGEAASPAYSVPSLALLLLVFCFGWAFQQYGFVLQAVAVSVQNYGDVALVTLASATAGAACVLYGVQLRPDPMGYLAGLATGYLSAPLLWLLLLRLRYVGYRSLSGFGRNDIASILSFGRWQALTQLAGSMGNQIDRYTLGALTSVSTVGRYNIAMRIQEVLYMAVLKAADVLFPYFASLGEDDLSRQQRVLATSSFALNTLAACVLAPLIVLADPLVNLWVGAEGIAGTSRILVTLVVAGLAGSSVNVYVFWAMGTGNNAGLALMSVLGAMVTVFVTIASIVMWGERAAGFGVLAGGLVMQAVAIRNLRRRFGPGIAGRTLIACGWPPLLAGTLLALLLRSIWPLLETWSSLFVAYLVLAVVIGIAAVLAAAMSNAGRASVSDSWRVAGSLMRRG